MVIPYKPNQDQEKDHWKHNKCGTWWENKAPMRTLATKYDQGKLSFAANKGRGSSGEGRRHKHISTHLPLLPLQVRFTPSTPYHT